MNRVDRWGVNPLDRHGVIEAERFHQELPTSVQPRANRFSSSSTHLARSIQMYSMYEAFARERMRVQLEQAAQHRLAEQLASARMWQRLASYAARRAARSRRRVADNSAADYQLAA